MAFNLFPKNFEFENNNFVVDDKKRNIELLNKKSYHFDFNVGDFVKDYNGVIDKVDNYRAYIQWCIKCLNTKRYTKRAYGQYYGVEYHKFMFKNYPKNYVEMEVERMTREALLVHPYTKKVHSFIFYWDKNNSEFYFEYTVDTELGNSFVLVKELKKEQWLEN